MPIRARENLYNGINAHLHSLLQARSGEWETFHAQHILHLAEAITDRLPPGYRVAPERSLQIRAFHPETGEPIVPTRRQRKQPDVTLFAVQPSPASGEAYSMPTLTLPTRETLEVDAAAYLTAFSIREVVTGEIGQPVTWLELLSPTNKPYGTGYVQYREKRHLTLHSGIALVEMDYLHESPPILTQLPSYPDHEPDAHPYLILVTNPRPSLASAQTQIYGIGVDAPLPTIPLPLAGEDYVSLSLQPIYNHSYSRLGYFGELVDYAQLPLNVERYHDTDQAKIRVRLAQIAAQQPGSA
jgi:hypothetical protein